MGHRVVMGYKAKSIFYMVMVSEISLLFFPVVDSDYDSAEERYSRRRPRRKTARYFNYNTETEDEESFATSELDDSDFERKRQKRLLKKDKKHKKSKKKSGKRHRIKRISSSDNSDGGDEEARPSVKKKGRKNRYRDCHFYLHLGKPSRVIVMALCPLCLCASLHLQTFHSYIFSEANE